MPGSVQNANPVTVMPDGLARSFTAGRVFWYRINSYRNGEQQVSLLAATSRNSWVFRHRLGMTDLVALRDFVDARGVEPFYFYDLITDKSAVYDATGVLTTGRHTVRFNGDWSQVAGMSRGSVDLQLLEVN